MLLLEQKRERFNDEGQLTSAIDARRSNSGIVLSLAENLIQNLLLFLSKVHFSCVGSAWVVHTYERLVVGDVFMMMFNSLVAHDNEEDNEKV